MRFVANFARLDVEKDKTGGSNTDLCVVKPKMSSMTNRGNKRLSTTITGCRICVRAIMSEATMYLRTIELAMLTPIIFKGDVI